MQGKITQLTTNKTYYFDVEYENGETKSYHTSCGIYFMESIGQSNEVVFDEIEEEYLTKLFKEHMESKGKKPYTCECKFIREYDNLVSIGWCTAKHEENIKLCKLATKILFGLLLTQEFPAQSVEDFCVENTLRRAKIFETLVEFNAEEELE